MGIRIEEETGSRDLNRFYEIPTVWQWIIALLLFALATSVLVLAISFSSDFLMSMLFLILLLPIAQFSYTPLFRLVGLYQYLSPMLLVFSPSTKKYDLHSGTTFDYLFVMRGTPAGMPARTKLLAHFIEGLLHITEQVEQGDLPGSIEVSGTSYFITQRMASRLGFEQSKLSTALAMNLWFNVIDLTLLYSYAQGKLSWPPLGKATSITSTGGKLLANKDTLRAQFARLQERQAREDG